MNGLNLMHSLTFEHFMPIETRQEQVIESISMNTPNKFM